MNSYKSYLIWGLIVLVSLVVCFSGFAKVAGHESMVQSFSNYHLPGWFRVLVGLLEIVGSILLLIPALSGMAAFGISIIMVGAFVTHLLHDPIVNSLPSVILFSMLTYIWMNRKNVIPASLQRFFIE